ncbi:unnamed protein product [Adineta ricciae]|uniref:Rapamycin-insensitive companion of mTOR n=1 Tax=Adineta ricciae TaxID=249248 RepID=A0A815KKY2_ADIRI|nr:unnamed protein product [Adineta ricciae]
MSLTFSHLCNQIAAASIYSSPYDVPKKPLSALLNEMTYYVAVQAKSSSEDGAIIFGLQLLLLSDVERVRAASIRALRYSIHREMILEKFLQYRLDYLICRSLAIDHGNARERFESYKFIRRFLHLYPKQIPHSFIYILDSIVLSSTTTTTTKQSDQMIKTSLELLCEIALHNPHILQECHVINTMLKFIVDFEQDELIESVIYALLHSIERFTINDNSEPTIVDATDPNGPALIFVDEGMRQRHEFVRNMFSQLVAVFPLCEKGNVKSTDRRGMTPAAYQNLTVKDAGKLKTLKSCTTALVTILHSWIGFTAFCQSKNSSVRLLVNSLIAQSEPMKMALLDLLYDLLNLDTPAPCDSYVAALQSIYPVWNLTTVEEGYTYVASEGAAKIPRISSTRPNLLDSHMALMLLTFIDAGFLEAITEVASCDNTILSIRATLLLANFIWLCNEHLPEEQSFLLLPLLMDIAIADDNSLKRSFAKEAMLHINTFFEFNKRTGYTHSFQLAQLIYHSQHFNDYFTLPQNVVIESTRKKSGGVPDDPLAAERIDNLIGDTNTLQRDDYKKWNWDLILALLKDFPKISNQIQGDLYERFLDKLYDFFKPEQKGGFRNIQLIDPLSDVTCRCLIAFSDLLLYPSRISSNHIKYIASNIARALLMSISNALKQSILAMREGIGQALIMDHDLLSRNAVYYYLFLGRLSKTSFGTEVLAEAEIFLRLLDMLKMDDDFATSAIVALSSFNYYYEGPCRHYLSQALRSSCTALRLYSTSLLRVILRCNPVAFGQWGLNLLTSQLNDTDQSVVLETVSVLDEALEDKRLVYLCHKQWDALESLSNKSAYLNKIYHLLSARFSSIPFQQIPSNDKHLARVREELYYWDQVFNSDYMVYMETRLFGAYSGGALLTDDYFERRKTPTAGGKVKRKRINIHVSSHIYRQLCLHNEGFRLLCTQSRLEDYATELKQHPTNCINLEETRAIKEALWALAHTASTENGYTWFMEKDLLADFLRFAEECQNLSVRGTAFYGLSLIAQTPDGAMSLKDFGWETYRVRAHSIPSSVANTDSYQCAERRLTKTGTISSMSKTFVQQPKITSTDNLTKHNINEPSTADISGRFRYLQTQDSMVPDVKSKRSLTMPSTILLNSTEKSDIRCTPISEESGSPPSTKMTATVSFPDGFTPGDGPLLVTVPVRRSSVSKDLISLSIQNDSSLNPGRTSSFSEIDSTRSPSFGANSYTNQTSSTTVQSTTDSLPLERLRPRSKSAHQSNALRRSKQLQKIPEVIQALRAPTATNEGRAESSATEELYRSRLLRCNFLLKLDAAGYEYARRVQERSHAVYTYLTNANNDREQDSNMNYISIIAKKNELLSPFYTYRSKFFKKMYETHSVRNQNIDQFTTSDGKYSLEQRDLDDADEDGNTIYRGLAVPVDIRQVVEISDGCNLNYETWSDLVRSRSRANTNADQTRTRSATNASNGSGEFAPATSPLPTNPSHDQSIPIAQSLSPTIPSITTPTTVTTPICMMCNSSSHEDPKTAMQKDFINIKSLSSRLIVSIHSEEVEKQLLSLKESDPYMFDNICLYSEVCHILSLSNVRIAAQRFLHDLFSDCHFEKLRKRQHKVEILQEEEDEQ